MNPTSIMSIKNESSFFDYFDNDEHSIKHSDILEINFEDLLNSGLMI